MRKRRLSKGFTLIELMIVVSIIGILAAVALPKFADLIEKAKAASMTNQLMAKAAGFRLYMTSNEGQYPPDTNMTLPSGMEPFLDKTAFESERPLGGRWNWDGPSFYGYAAMSINQPSSDARTIRIITLIDQKLDDGILSTGDFTYGNTSGSYKVHWIFDRP